MIDEGLALGAWTAMGLGTVAALQPGAFQAYLLDAALRRGVSRALPLAFAPLLSDLPIALVATMVLSSVPDGPLRLVGGFGALFTAWLGVRAVRDARRSTSSVGNGGDEDANGAPPGRTETVGIERGELRRDLVRGALVNLLNPAPWAFWVLVLGPLVATAASHSWLNAAIVVAAFYATMIGSTCVLVIAFGALGRIGPRTTQALRWVSGAALLTFACLLGWNALWGSGSGSA